jgi:hypothetical protein
MPCIWGILKLLEELYYEKAVELSKEQSSDKLNDDDAVSAASSSYHSIRTTGTGKCLPKSWTLLALYHVS